MASCSNGSEGPAGSNVEWPPNFAIDQVNYLKMELGKLRKENDRLMSKVGQVALQETGGRGGAKRARLDVSLSSVPPMRYVDPKDVFFFNPVKFPASSGRTKTLLNSTIESLQAKKAAAVTTRGMQEKVELTKLKSEYADLQKATEAKDMEIAKQVEEISALNDKNKKCVKKIVDLKKNLLKLQPKEKQKAGQAKGQMSKTEVIFKDDVIRLKDVVCQTERQNQLLRQVIDKMKREASQLKDAFKASVTKNNEQHKEIGVLIEKNKELLTQVFEIKKSREDLEKQKEEELGREKEKCAEMQEQLDKQDWDLESLKMQVQEAKDQAKSKLEARDAKLKDTSTTYETRITALDSLVEEQTNEIRRLNANNAELVLQASKLEEAKAAKNKEQQIEIDALTEKDKELVTQISELKKSLRDLEKQKGEELGREKEKCAQMQEQLDKQDWDLESLKMQVQEAKDQAKSKLEAGDFKLQETRASFETRIVELNSLVEEQTNKIRDLTANNAELILQTTELEKRISEIGVSVFEHIQLEAEKNNLQMKLEQADNKALQLQDMVDSQNVMMVALTEQIDELENSCEIEQKLQEEKMETICSKHRQTMQELNDAIEMDKANVASLQNEKASLAQQKADFEKHCQELTGKVDSLLRQKDQLEVTKTEEISKIIEEKSKLQNKLNEEIDNNKEYERMIEELRDDLKAKEEQLVELENKATYVNSMEESLSKKVWDMDQLTKQNASLKQEVTELNRTKDETNAKIDQMQQEQTELRGEIARLQNEKEASEQELHCKVEEVEQTNKELKVVHTAREDLRKKLADLKDSIVEYQNKKTVEIGNLHKDRDNIKADLDKKLETSQSEKWQLDQTIGVMKKAIEDYRKEEDKLDKVEQEKNTLEQRLHKVEYETDKLRRSCDKKDKVLQEHAKCSDHLVVRMEEQERLEKQLGIAKDKETRFGEWSEEKELMKKTIAQLKRELTTARQAKTKAEKKIDETRQKYEEELSALTCAEMEQKQGADNELVEQNAKLNDDLKNLKEVHENSEQKQVKLQKKLEEYYKMNRNQKNHYDQLVSSKDSEIESLQKQVEKRSDAMEKMRQVNLSQSDTINLQKRTITEHMQIRLTEPEVTGNKMKGLQKTVRTLQVTITDLECKVASLEGKAQPGVGRKEPISVIID